MWHFRLRQDFENRCWPIIIQNTHSCDMETQIVPNTRNDLNTNKIIDGNIIGSLKAIA